MWPSSSSWQSRKSFGGRQRVGCGRWEMGRGMDIKVCPIPMLDFEFDSFVHTAEQISNLRRSPEHRIRMSYGETSSTEKGTVGL